MAPSWSEWLGPMLSVNIFHGLSWSYASVWERFSLNPIILMTIALVLF